MTKLLSSQSLTRNSKSKTRYVNIGFSLLGNEALPKSEYQLPYSSITIVLLSSTRKRLHGAAIALTATISRIEQPDTAPKLFHQRMLFSDRQR